MTVQPLSRPRARVASPRRSRITSIPARPRVPSMITTRHAGYAISQVKRKLVEEVCGWAKTIGGLRKLHHRGYATGEGCSPPRTPRTTSCRCARSCVSAWPHERLPLLGVISKLPWALAVTYTD